MSEYRYFESGYFEPFFDALFESAESVPEEDGTVGYFGTFFGTFFGTHYGPVEEVDVISRVTSGEWVCNRLRLLWRQREREDEEALIALLVAAMR